MTLKEVFGSLTLVKVSKLKRETKRKVAENLNFNASSVKHRGGSSIHNFLNQTADVSCICYTALI